MRDRIPYTRVSSVASLCNGIPFSATDFMSGGGIPLIRIRDLLGSAFDTFVSNDIVPSDAIVRNGDVLIGMDGDFNPVMWTRGTAALNQRVCLLRCHDRADQRFLYYSLIPAMLDINRKTLSTTVKHLSSADVLQRKIWWPRSSVRRHVVSILDVETAKIDHLIAKQRELIDLTKERADADIEASIWGQLVQTDREPNVIKRSYCPRDISILALADRLSALPRTWDIQRFKWVFSRKDDRNADLTLEMLSLRQTGAVVPRSETRQNQEPSEASIPKYLAVRPGDLVVNPMWMTGGAIGVSDRAGAVSPDYRVFAIAEQLLPHYAHEILRSVSYRRQSKLFERASTTFDRRIQQIDLDNLPVPIPPKKHQEVILRNVRQIHKRTNQFVEAIERHIELAQERRSALITAAVTGQIEV